MKLLIQYINLCHLFIIAISIEVITGEEKAIQPLINVYNNRRLQSLCLGMIRVD